MKYDNQERLNIKTYKNLFKKYGYSYKSLDWGSKKNQLLRFKILSKIGNLNKKKILDVGCGFGDFYLWLKKKHKKIEYTGIDVVSDMIKEAKRKHKKIKFSCENILKKKVRLDQKFDYIFASGIFAYNKKDGNKILKKTILKMWNLSNKGVAFNCLSSKCIYKNKNEFYADPEKVLIFCKKLTPFVKIKENYLPSDFTVYLKKNK